MNIEQQIDEALNASTVAQQNTELGRLAEMFKDPVLRNIEIILNEDRTDGTDRFRLSFGWIDKRPYAKQQGGPAERIELGDLAVIFIHDVTNARDPDKPLEGRCALMQAKLQDEVTPAGLNVLFDKSDLSSRNQFDLLERWGYINLYRNSRGDEEFDTSPFTLPKRTPPYGWFMGAYRQAQDAQTQVASWMCGEPAMGAPCDKTLGEVIVSLCFSSSPCVGVKFSLPRQFNAASISDHWNRLVATLIELCSAQNLPKWGSRVAGAQSRLKGTIRQLLHFVSFGLMKAYDPTPSSTPTPRSLDDYLRTFKGTLAPSHKSEAATPDDAHPMAVLIIVRKVLDH